MEAMDFKSIIAVETALEAGRTERIFNVLPDNHKDYRPHDKSMTLKELAEHVAELQTWFNNALRNSSYDFKNDNQELLYSSFKELGSLVNESVQHNLDFIKSTDDDFWNQEFTFRVGDHVVMTVPRWVAYRQMLSNHLIHHRGQLTTYLRALNIPVPGMFGPSADEKNG